MGCRETGAAAETEKQDSGKEEVNLNIPSEIKNEMMQDLDSCIGRICFDRLPDRYEKDGWEQIGNDCGAITYSKGKRRIKVFPYGKTKKWMAK